MMGRDHDNYECEAKVDELRAENERLKALCRDVAEYFKDIRQYDLWVDYEMTDELWNLLQRVREAGGE